MKGAEEAFSAGDFETCLVNCRKAIFVRIESNYDISPFGNDAEPKGLGLWLFGNKAPFFARSKDYINKSVKDATDYIVLDHKEVEMDLMKSGMDSVSFWNILRLTPQVFRAGQGAAKKGRVSHLLVQGG